MGNPSFYSPLITRYRTRYGTRRYRQHRYSLISVESTAHFFQITAVSNRACRLLFRNGAYLSPALPPAHTHSAPARPPSHSPHFFKSPTVQNMEFAGKRGAEELVCKRKKNGSIVWKWFAYQVSDELQNQLLCREYFKSRPKIIADSRTLVLHD